MLGGYGGDNFRSDAGDDFIDGGTASDLDAILAAASPVASAQTLVDPGSADTAEGSFDVYFVLNGHSNGQFGEYWALRGDGTSFRVDALMMKKTRSIRLPTLAGRIIPGFLMTALSIAAALRRAMLLMKFTSGLVTTANQFELQMAMTRLKSQIMAAKQAMRKLRGSLINCRKWPAALA